MRVKSLMAAIVLVSSMTGLAAHADAAVPTRGSAPAASASARPPLPSSAAKRAATTSRPSKATTKHVTPPPLASPTPTAPGKVPTPGNVPASAMAPADRTTQGRAAIPAGDSLVSVPGGDPANLRNDACLSNSSPVPDPWAPYDPCGINAQAPDGSYVIMRCWTDTIAVPQYSSSPRWFFVTRDTGNPETNVSGFIYSALVTVASQVKTPNCNTTDYSSYYPYRPSDASITISNRPTASVFTISLDVIAFGPATLYCHVGTAANYPTGGSVVNLGQYTINLDSYGDNFTIPVCGTGNQWVGIIAANGIIRYSNQVAVGSGSPPPPPPTPGYLGGIAGQPLTFSTTSGYVVGSSITVTGYPAENFGQTNVSVASLALAVTSPTGVMEWDVCYSSLTVAPGQIVYCPGTFTPDVAGSWALNLDWQGSDGSWHDLYEPLYIQIDAAPSAPANDDFANAQDITGRTGFNGTNVGATAEPGEPDHYLGSPAQNSVWFKFTAPETGRAWVSIDNSTDVTALAGYTGTAVSTLRRLATWDAMGNEVIVFSVTTGVEYYLAVDDDYGANPGAPFTGVIAMEPITRPANDDFAHSQPITPGTVYTAEFIDATTEPGEPAAWPGEPDYGSVWYFYKPSADVTMTFSSVSAGDPVVFGVFTGDSVKTLSRVDYDWVQQGHSWTVALSAGEAYYIAIDNYYNAPDQISGVPPTMGFQLKATVKPQPPVVTTALPTLYSKARYSIQLHAKDGAGPYTWKLAQPSFLSGFTLSTSGVLSGSTTGSGTGALYVSVTDSESPKVTAITPLTLHVVRDTNAPSGRITKTTASRGALTIYWTAADSQSGYDHAQIRVQRVVITKGTQPQWAATGALRGTSAKVAIKVTALYRVEIRFVDKSGNVSAWTPAKVVAVQA